MLLKVLEGLHGVFLDNVLLERLLDPEGGRAHLAIELAPVAPLKENGFKYSNSVPTAQHLSHLPSQKEMNIGAVVINSTFFWCFWVYSVDLD